MNIIEVKNIHKTYENHKALDGVSLNIKKGEVFGLLGPNGAGKTTLIRIITRIAVKDQGEVLFDGKPMTDKDIGHVGYLPEERGLYKKMEVGEQALYLAQLKGLSKKVAMERLKYWFEKYDIIDWWKKKVSDLSKGMQQKIQFICTIIHEPKLLIFDEPFSGFDPVNANLLKEEILNLRDKGATVIFSTHQMGSVEEICDSIALINNSKKVLEGSLEEVKAKYKTDKYIVKGDYDLALLEENLPQYRFVEAGSSLEIKDLEKRGANGVLTDIIPFIKIESFTEKIISLNDIFIKIVTDKEDE